MKLTRDTLFKPNLSKGEVKGDATTRAAWAIIDQEKAGQDAKTARLRAARLAKEAAEQEAAASAPPPAPKARKSAAARKTG